MAYSISLNSSSKVLPITAGRHLVISGFPRAGTTMLYLMMKWSVSGFSFPTKEQPARRLIEHPTPHNIISKRPLNIFDVKNIMAANRFNRNLGWIVCVRDPRDIITSIHTSVPDDYFVGWDHQYFVPGNGPPTYSNPGVIPTFEAIDQLLNDEAVAEEKKMVVKYEDLVRDTQAIQESIANQFKVEMKGDFSDFHKGTVDSRLGTALGDEGMRPVEASAVSRWTNPKHRDRIIRQIEQCPALLDVIVKLGYETDHEWFEDFKSG